MAFDGDLDGDKGRRLPRLKQERWRGKGNNLNKLWNKEEMEIRDFLGQGMKGKCRGT